MALFSVVAQITYDTEEAPNLDGIADMLANWQGVRRVRVRPAGMPKAAVTVRSTAASRFKDLYTEQQFLDHENEIAAGEAEAQADLTGVENPSGSLVQEPEPAPASGPVEPLPDDAKPSRAKRA
jgi:hypothetical protein